VPVGAPATFETEQLQLFRPRPEHAPDICARYAGDRDVTRYVGWPRHRSVADTRSFIAFSDAEWARWPVGPYLIGSRQTGALLGSTGLACETAERALTGYVLAKDAWGRGYATEALGAMIRLAESHALTELFSYCHPDHRPSAHVLESCGFVRDQNQSRQAEFPNLSPGISTTVASYVLALGQGVGAAHSS
jgi:ribosomal-protein-alanine N-acetyltransferase